MTILDYARAYLNGGLSIIPIKADASKQPALKAWKTYETQLPTAADIELWWAKPRGIAIIGGAVSGNLERIDFDAPGIYDQWLELASQCGYSDLIESLPLVKTPREGSGHHIYYRCSEPVQGNQKLAARWSSVDNKPHGIIETRGEGGYTLAPGSPPQCHETHRTYDLIRGDLANIPIITPDQRTALLEMARSFNEYVHETKVQGRTTEATDTTMPGNDFNARGDWRSVLTRAGWRHCWNRGEVEYWRRPGKARGISATWNYLGSQVFYVFSTSAHPLQDLTSYTPFGLYATLEHGGDYTEAARALRADGYGSEAESGVIVHKSTGADDENFDAILAKRPLTDLGNAERFLARHRDTVMHCPQLGWLVWDGMRWKQDDTGQVTQYAAKTVRSIVGEAGTLKNDDHRKALLKHARASESANKIANILILAKSWLSVSHEDLDPDPWLLNCTNGTLDLRTCELLDHRRDNHITTLAPYPYEPDAPCPKWLAFLDLIFQGNQALIDYAHRAVGYALTGVIRDQCLFFCYGHGANGKSTFLGATRGILGDYGLNTPSETLMVKQNEGINNDIARLRGTRMVTSVEPDEGKRLAESLVKQLTGGDTITARFLHKEYFQFQGSFKLFLGANHKPGIRGTDEGIWRRIKTLPFIMRIPDDQQIKGYEDILREEEAPGILAWMVRGCRDWQRHGLEEPSEVTEATAAYRADMDYLGPFLSEQCLIGPRLTVPANELYRAYVDYCETNKEKPTSAQMFGRLLSDRSGIERRRLGRGNEYLGIGLLTNYNEDLLAQKCIHEPTPTETDPEPKHTLI
jgi:P4 family phage/plasmid primase-like protien